MKSRRLLSVDGQKTALIMTYDVSIARDLNIDRFRDTDILLRRSAFSSFCFFGSALPIARSGAYFIKRRGLRPYFETIKPGIYMRSRSLTAGSAGRRSYAPVCVRACVSQ